MTVPVDSGGGRQVAPHSKPKRRKRGLRPDTAGNPNVSRPSRPAKRPDTAGNPNVSRPSGKRPDTAGNPNVGGRNPEGRVRPTAQQRARTTERAYRSQARSVATQAILQRLNHYANSTPEARRQILHEIHTTPNKQRTLAQLAILQLHNERSRVDKAQAKLTGVVPHITYKNTPSVTRFNKMPPEVAKLVSASRAGKPIYRKASESSAGDVIGGLGEEAAALGVATYHDPVGVPVKTVKQLGRSLPAVPGGVYDAVVHPKKTLKETVGGFEERTAKQSFKEKVKHIRQEGGLAYVGDVLTVVPAGGEASKLLARTTKRGAKFERAGVRLSGGVVKPRRDRNLYAEAIGNADAKRRAAKAEKKLARAEAGGAPVDVVTRQAAEANRRAGRVVETPARFAGTRQRRLVATQRSRAIYGLRHDQGVRTRAAGKTLAKLNSKERRAFYYAATLGIRSADQARELLPKLRDKITATRVRDGVQVTGSLKKSDMIPDIDRILADPEGHFTPRLGDTVEALRPDSMKAGMEDPGLTPGQRMLRRYAPLADVLGLRRGEDPHATEWAYVPGEGDFTKAAERAGHAPDIEGELVGLPPGPHPERGSAPLQLPRGAGEVVPGSAVGEAIANVASGEFRARRRAGQGYYEERPGHRYFDETDAEFIRRLHGHMEGLGLSKPLYFKSERYVGPRDFGAFTAGGKAAVAFDQRYKGTNLRAGLQDTSTTQYIRGLARNIKRKHNWNLVADLLDQNAIKEYGGHFEGSTIKALRERLAQDGVDFGSVAFWNPGVYRAMAREQIDNPELHRFARAEEVEASQIAGLNSATVRVNRAGQAIDGSGEVIPEEMLIKQSGWHVVPDSVVKELEAQMHPSGVPGRSVDIAKGKASRAILLTGNVPWLGFQVVSNAAMAAVATGGRALNPANWLGTHRWWKALTPEEQQRVGGMLGLDATGADAHQVRMGAATNNDFVNAYRAFKDHPFWHSGVARGRGPSLSQLNPLELMARADRSQTNAFRKLAGYSNIKRMGHAMARADGEQAKLMNIFRMPPEKQLKAIAADRDILERHAKAINDWMGDYTTLTAAERKVLGRAVMFYPYVRYSLRLLFWTMPIDHPIMTGVLAELGQLKADELAQLFGENNLPWNSGKLFFGSDGNLKSIDLKRANPLLSAPIDAMRAHEFGKLVGVMPPYVGWLADQAYGKSAFSGKDWKFGGQPTGYGGAHPDMENRGRILLNDMLGMMYPTRAYQALGHDPRLQGTQGDDSLPWSPRPIHYKGTDEVGKLQKKFARRRQRFEDEHESILRELIPLLPQPDRAPAEAREQAIVDKAQQPNHHKRRSGGYRFGGSSKGYRFGG